MTDADKIMNSQQSSFRFLFTIWNHVKVKSGHFLLTESDSWPYSFQHSNADAQSYITILYTPCPKKARPSGIPGNWGSLNSRSEIPGNFKSLWFVKKYCAKFWQNTAKLALFSSVIWFLPRDAMHKRGYCRHAVSVCLSVSVCHVRELRQNEFSSSNFFHRLVAKPF